tara:strand:- start:138 stop:1037 length:900 start_codon:yes stop_codon:yes gene_type:complete
LKNIFSFTGIIACLLPIFIFTSCSSIKNEEKKQISSKIIEYVKDKSSLLQNVDFIKNSELEIENKSENFDADFRLSILGSIDEDESNKNFLLNQSNISRQSDDTTVNIGFINRKLSEDKNWLYGVNIFYDQEFPENHQRASIGFEIKSQPVEFNFNYYDAFSNTKAVGDTTEKAMDGYDAEVGLQVPYIPQAKLFFSTYEWDGDDFDIKDGKKANLRFKSSNKITFEIGIDDNSKYDDAVTTAKISYNFLAKNQDEPKALISEKMFEHSDQSKNIYNMVRRQNRIVKTITGTVTVGRGT